MEIGCHRGELTRLLGHQFPERKVYAVDLPAAGDLMLAEQSTEGLPEDRIAELAKEYPNVSILLADSKTLDYPPDVGFIFIDADHSEAGVAADTALALVYARKAARAVKIVWHDFHRPDIPWIGVEAALKKFGDLRVKHYQGTMIAEFRNPQA